MQCLNLVLLLAAVSSASACKYFCRAPGTFTYECCDDGNPYFNEDKSPDTSTAAATSEQTNLCTYWCLNPNTSEYVCCDNGNPFLDEVDTDTAPEINETSKQPPSNCFYYCAYDGEVYCCGDSSRPSEYNTPGGKPLSLSIKLPEHINVSTKVSTLPNLTPTNDSLNPIRNYDNFYLHLFRRPPSAPINNFIPADPPDGQPIYRAPTRVERLNSSETETSEVESNPLFTNVGHKVSILPNVTPTNNSLKAIRNYLPLPLHLQHSPAASLNNFIPADPPNGQPLYSAPTRVKRSSLSETETSEEESDSLFSPLSSLFSFIDFPDVDFSHIFSGFQTTTSKPTDVMLTQSPPVSINPTLKLDALISRNLYGDFKDSNDYKRHAEYYSDEDKSSFLWLPIHTDTPSLSEASRTKPLVLNNLPYGTIISVHKPSDFLSNLASSGSIVIDDETDNVHPVIHHPNSHQSDSPISQHNVHPVPHHPGSHQSASTISHHNVHSVVHHPDLHEPVVHHPGLHEPVEHHPGLHEPVVHHPFPSYPASHSQPHFQSYFSTAVDPSLSLGEYPPSSPFAPIKPPQFGDQENTANVALIPNEAQSYNMAPPSYDMVPPPKFSNPSLPNPSQFQANFDPPEPEFNVEELDNLLESIFCDCEDIYGNIEEDCNCNEFKDLILVFPPKPLEPYVFVPLSSLAEKGSSVPTPPAIFREQKIKRHIPSISIEKNDEVALKSLTEVPSIEPVFEIPISSEESTSEIPLPKSEVHAHPKPVYKAPQTLPIHLSPKPVYKAPTHSLPTDKLPTLVEPISNDHRTLPVTYESRKPIIQVYNAAKPKALLSQENLAKEIKSQEILPKEIISEEIPSVEIVSHETLSEKEAEQDFFSNPSADAFVQQFPSQQFPASETLIENQSEIESFPSFSISQSLSSKHVLDSFQSVPDSQSDFPIHSSQRTLNSHSFQRNPSSPSFVVNPSFQSLSQGQPNNFAYQSLQLVKMPNSFSQPLLNSFLKSMSNFVQQPTMSSFSQPVPNSLIKPIMNRLQQTTPNTFVHLPTSTISSSTANPIQSDTSQSQIPETDPSSFSQSPVTSISSSYSVSSSYSTSSRNSPPILPKLATSPNEEGFSLADLLASSSLSG